MNLEEIKKTAKSEEKNEKQETLFATSLINRNEIVEMVFDKSTEKTSFLVWNGTDITEVSEYERNGILYKPYPATKNIIRNGTVTFASGASDYTDTAELVHDVQTFIRKYLTVSEEFEPIAVHYTLLSWVYDDFNELPYLRALGEYGHGKSRFLQVIGGLCYKQIAVGGAGSVSSAFRLLDEYRGTLVIDEADLNDSDTYNQLVKILNSGFQRGIPVTRARGDKNNNFDVESFDVYGPKIIGARYHFKDDALESRILTEDMGFIEMRDDVETNTTDEFYEEMLTLRNKLLMYRFRNKGNMVLNKELIDKTIEPRLRQISLPLLSIIEDDESLKALQDYLREYNKVVKNDRTHSFTYQISEIICELIGQGYPPTMQQIATKFNESTGYGDSKSAKQIGFIVRKHLGLQTERTQHGYIVSRANHRKLIAIAKKNGFDDMNFMNVMNVDKEDKE